MKFVLNLYMVILWVLNPILSLIIITKFGDYKYIKIGFISLTFGLIAYTQVSTVNTTDYDIIRYYSSYNYFSNLSFQEVIKVILEKGDFLFYIIIYLISKIISNHPQMVSLIMCFCTSFTYFLLIYEMQEYNDKEQKLTLKILLCLLLLSNFPLIMNAYRSYLGFNLAILSIFKYLNNKKIFKYIYLSSIFIHWSSLLFLPLYLLLKYKCFFSFYKKIIIILFILQTFILEKIINAIGINFFTKNLTEYDILKMDLGKSFYVYLVMIIIYLLLTNRYFEKSIQIINIYMISLLIIFFNNPMLLFRLTLLVGSYSIVIYIMLIKINIKNKITRYIQSIYFIITIGYWVKNYYLGNYIFLFKLKYNLFDYIKTYINYYLSI